MSQPPFCNRSCIQYMYLASSQNWILDKEVDIHVPENTDRGHRITRSRQTTGAVIFSGLTPTTVVTLDVLTGPERPESATLALPLPLTGHLASCDIGPKTTMTPYTVALVPYLLWASGTNRFNVLPWLFVPGRGLLCLFYRSDGNMVHACWVVLRTP